MTNRSTQQPWLDVGYALFAEEGPSALKVERLARRVGKSKSSFYHCFADVAGFTSALLDYHLERLVQIAKEEGACANVDPELLQYLLTIEVDLRFQRWLRVHRDQPEFKACLERGYALTADAITDIWAEAIGLPRHTGLAYTVLVLTMENFYLQLTPETLNYPWLKAYVQRLRQLVGALQAAPVPQLAALLDGSV